jgi:hypothetical protein
METKGQLLFRDLETETKAPKGYKYMLVVGVVKVPAKLGSSIETAIEGQLDETGLSVSGADASPKNMPLFETHNADDLVRSYPWKVSGKKVDIESTRSEAFTRAANRALGMIAKGRPIQGKDREDLDVLLPELIAYHNAMDELDFMKVTVGTVIKLLSEPDGEPTRKKRKTSRLP